MRVLAKSDIGKAREMNQDSFYVSDLEKDELKLYIVADGMGGYKGGEIASSLAVSSAKKYIENNFKKTKKDRESILVLLKEAVEYANKIIYEKAIKDPELHDMGTTLDICLIYNNKVFIGHIGDSRVYRIRKNIIRKLTTDHSYVEKLLKEGTITKEEAYNHPKKNMLRDNEIYDLLLKNPEKPVDALIKNANDLGGYDNITAIIIDNIDIGEETKER